MKPVSTDDSNVNKVKLSRRNTKGQLTRTLGVIKDLIHGDDPEIVKEYMARAQQQFAKVEEKHGELMEMIQDEQEFENEARWMSDCEEEYVRVLLNAKSLSRIHSHPRLLQRSVSNQNRHHPPHPLLIHLHHLNPQGRHLMLLNQIHQGWQE